MKRPDFIICLIVWISGLACGAGGEASDERVKLNAARATAGNRSDNNNGSSRVTRAERSRQSEWFFGRANAGMERTTGQIECMGRFTVSSGWCCGTR